MPDHIDIADVQVALLSPHVFGHSGFKPIVEERLRIDAADTVTLVDKRNESFSDEFLIVVTVVGVT